MPDERLTPFLAECRFKGGSIVCKATDVEARQLKTTEITVKQLNIAPCAGVRVKAENNRIILTGWTDKPAADIIRKADDYLKLDLSGFEAQPGFPFQALEFLVKDGKLDVSNIDSDACE